MSTFTVKTTGTLIDAVTKSTLTKPELRTLLQRSGFEVQAGDVITKGSRPIYEAVHRTNLTGLSDPYPRFNLVAHSGPRCGRFPP
jgi:predicted HAD superfamily Cof-like phosphohydrolase